MRDQKIVNEFKVVEWNTLGELEQLLTVMTNEGWQVDNHHLATPPDKGWTIFRKITWVNPPLLERKVPLSTVYSILNQVLQPETGVEPLAAACRTISRELKDAVRVENDTF